MERIKRVLFLGSKKIGYQSLLTIYHLNNASLIGIITIDDRNDERSVYDEFQHFSKDHNIDLFVVENKQESEDLIKKLKPELCIVVGWYWIISNEVLKNVPYGFLGVHGSQLPKYRGGSPIVWAIINGEKNVGVSLFSFGDGIDNGPIWNQKIIEIGSNEYIYEILNKIEQETINIFQENYLLILKGLIKPKPQNRKNATYCAQRIPDDGLIDWTKPAVDVFNFIRAQAPPYPGSFTFYDGEKLKIVMADLADMTFYGTPGQIGKISNEGVYIICGDNKPIIVKKVQYKTKEKIPAQQILKSIKLRL